jgi:hypothetical protein
MDPAVFKAIQPMLDKFADLADKQLLSADVQRLLAEFADVVGPKKAVSINITVDLCDEEREVALPLLTTGLSGFPGKEPFRTWAIPRRSDMSSKREFRSCHMIAARSVRSRGISNCKIHRVHIAASRWVKRAS